MLTIPSFYRSSGGAEIDLILELPTGDTWAIEIKLSLTPKLNIEVISLRAICDL